MYLKLTTPFNPGMNDAGNTYPIISITQMTDNPNTKLLQFIYEAGQFSTVTNADKTTSTVWTKGPGALSQYVNISGTAYSTLIATAAANAADLPYKAIYRAMYLYLIAQGTAGTIVDA